MKRITWLVLLLVIVSVMLIVVNTGITTSYFVDDEPSTDDALGIRWGLFTLNDGFEAAGAAWDDNWDENGTTTWIQDSAKPNGGVYNAYSDLNNNGYLTTDEIEASTTDSITVSFYFNTKSLEAGDCLVQRYDGTAYVTWYDITSYSTYTNNAWCLFNEVIDETEPQYLIAGFRLRFDTSGLVETNEEANIDDVIITTDTTAPLAPTGLVATAAPGDTEVSLDWAGNTESDLWGYNVYRSTTMGGPYSQINGSPVVTNSYTDDTVTELVTYYYVVTAVDFGSNESGYSNEDSATPDWAPLAPTGLVATAAPGDTEVSLGWADNSEGDLDGYNVHRSESIGGPYSQINGSLVATSIYTDSTVTELVTYYYVVAAVDLVANESGYSNEDSATPDWAPAAPTGLVATDGDLQVSLDWADNGEGDLDGYNVHRSEIISGPYSQINGSLVAASEYTDNTVTSGVLYYYVVTAVDLIANEGGYSNEDSATPFDTDPAAPTGLVATAAPGDTEVSLGWADNSESDLDGYNVYRSTTTGGSYSQINGSLVLTSSYTDNTVTELVTYYYVVKAVDLGSNASSYSNEDNATPDWAPLAPTGLVATAAPGDTEVTLDWNDNSEGDLDGYNVHRSESIGGPYSQINGSLVAASEYTDSTVTELVTYYYVVKAVDSGSNESGYSNEDSATPDWAPAAPTSLIATPGERQVTLDWADNSESDLASYNIYRSESGGGPYTYLDNSVTSDYLDSGLTLDTTYYYVVTAVDDGSNESENSAEASATPIDTPPAAPTGLLATGTDQGQLEVTLDWADNSESDLASYNIYRSESGGGPYTYLDNSVTSDYLDSGLTLDTTYYYVVTAVDTGANESENSTEASATPIDIPPAAPTGLLATGTDQGELEVTLDWDDNSEGDVASYNIYRSLTSGSGYAYLDNSVSSDYLDSGLTLDTTYYYVVTAVDANNESENSTEASATATDIPPAAPTGLLATGTDQGELEVTLDWDDNSGTDLASYNIYRSLTSGSGYAYLDNSVSSDYLDSGLTLDTTYYYVATAVDANNESEDSTEASATATDIPPAAPTGLLATGTDQGELEVTLDWDDNGEGDVASYNIYRSLTSGSGYAYLDNNTSSDYLDSGLTLDTTYYYVVTAVDANNESEDSTEASATATDVAPVAPTGLLATKGVGKVTLDWNDNSEGDLAGYDVYRSETMGGPYSQINGSLVVLSEYTDSTVTNGVTYYYVVKAVDSGSNESDYSNEDSARPVGPPQTLLNDGFEFNLDPDPWDVNWDGNGTTTWAQDSAKPHTGTYNANISNTSTPGYLTSDDLDTFAAENITVSFWFNIKSLEAGDCVLQIYNGSTWITWYDLLDYPTYVNNVWCQFSEVITDSQYFISDFRIRFDSSVLGDSTEQANIDDVLIEINQ